MKIFIQGRKDGYKVLYPKPTPAEFYSFASDIQSISANNNDIYWGKSFYTLALTDGGCIFTKYIIGDDVQRGQLGEIGISILIPSTQKLPGTDVKKQLDELITTYIENYIIENKIVEPKTSFDWLLFTSIADKYDEKILLRSTENDNIITGLKDPALYYYKSESDLIEHLDKPFQEEYNTYRQILFISSELKGVSDPKNVLTNSGEEVNPDLKNEYYYLNNYNFSKGITITANGKPRSDKKGENQIRAKWQVEIKYSKDDRCFEPINVKGTLSDINSEIYKYLEIKGNQIQIKYSAFDNPTEKLKEVVFEIKDQKLKPVEGAEIQIGTRPWEKANDSKVIISFSGEENIQQWKVSAKKESEDLYSSTVPIVPDSQIGSVELIMHKQKVVRIFATDKDTGDNISNFTFWCNGGKWSPNFDNEITFLNDDIDKIWNIEVSKKEGQFRYLGKKEYRPASGENPLYIQCEKKVEQNNFDKTYKIDAGEHGDKTSYCPAYSNSSTGDDLSHHCIKPNNGYVFKGKWEIQNETLVAQYEKRKTFASKAKTFLSKSSVIASLIVSVIVIAIGVLLVVYYLKKDKPDVTPLTAIQINEYILGDSLMLDKLYSYEEKWKTQEGDGEVLKSLKQAIEKRTKINSKHFHELDYPDFKKSEQQRIFYKSIDGIDSTKNEEISSLLGDISSLTLTQIIDSINAVLTLNSEEVPENQSQVQEVIQDKEEKNKTKNDEPEYITNYLKTSSGFELSTINQYYKVKGLSRELNTSLELVKYFIGEGYKNCNSFIINTRNDRFLKTNPNIESWVEKVCEDGSTNASNSVAKSNNPMQTPVSTDKTAEIIQYLKGSELDEAKLKEYKTSEGINQNLKNSIQLCLDFWELDGSVRGKNAKTYYSFQKKINADNVLKNSNLKEFVDKMCQEGVKPSYSEIDKKRGLK